MSNRIDYREIEIWVEGQLKKGIHCASDSRHKTELIYSPDSKVYRVIQNGELSLATTDCEKAVERFNDLNYY